MQAPTDTFKPKDTIFAVVSTDGSAAASVIAVKWTFGDGQTVKEDSKTIAPTGPATTEFSIQKPKGWPKGSYKVETTVDGKPGPSKTFTVESEGRRAPAHPAGRSVNAGRRPRCLLLRVCLRWSARGTRPSAAAGPP